VASESRWKTLYKNSIYNGRPGESPIPPFYAAPKPVLGESLAGCKTEKESEKVSRSRDYIGEVPLEIAERIIEARKRKKRR